MSSQMGQFLTMYLARLASWPLTQRTSWLVQHPGKTPLPPVGVRLPREPKGTDAYCTSPPWLRSGHQLAIDPMFQCTMWRAALILRAAVVLSSSMLMSKHWIYVCLFFSFSSLGLWKLRIKGNTGISLLGSRGVSIKRWIRFPVRITNLVYTPSEYDAGRGPLVCHLFLIRTLSYEGLVRLPILHPF